MIHKLLKIENVGTFVKAEFNTPNWNGVLQKYNAIYADNGCGKTTSYGEEFPKPWPRQNFLVPLQAI